MTTNQSQLAPLNAPPTIRELNQNQAQTVQEGQGELKNGNGQLALSENYAIQFELKNISRQVSKITEKQKYLNHRPQLTISTPNFNSAFNLKQLDNDFKNLVNLNTNGSQIGKYNYYGHRYRHEGQKQQKDEEKLTNLQEQQENQKLESFSPSIKHQHKRQKLNVPDSQSYFIYFDDPKSKSNFKDSHQQFNQSHQCFENKNQQSKNRIYLSQQLNETQKYQKKQMTIPYPEDNDQARTPPIQVFSKQEPSSKWVLQKKVKKLQKQLNTLKKKQQQRQKLKNFTYNQNKKDTKIYVGRQVDQLINSLWP